MSERSIGTRSGLLTQAHADRMRTPSMTCALRANIKPTNRTRKSKADA
ncbi:MAG: hypothetical protein JXQ97_03950 [Natronospirillum sp.]